MKKLKKWLVSLLVLASTNIINIYAFENDEMQGQLVKSKSTEVKIIYKISNVSFTKLSDSKLGMAISTNGFKKMNISIYQSSDQII